MTHVDGVFFSASQHIEDVGGSAAEKIGSAGEKLAAAGAPPPGTGDAKAPKGRGVINDGRLQAQVFAYTVTNQSQSLSCPVLSSRSPSSFRIDHRLRLLYFASHQRRHRARLADCDAMVRRVEGWRSRQGQEAQGRPGREEVDRRRAC